MGKKNKRKADASTSQPSPKRSKTSTKEPSPSLPKINYKDMPLNHKRKFYINDDCGSMMKYIEIISWLRAMGCYDGSLFEGIPNLNNSEESYPLVEIEVVTPQNNSAKFVISKMTLYMIAFYALKRWFQFLCEFEIEPFIMLRDFNGMYISEPWKQIGPKNMIGAVNLLAGQENDLSELDLSKVNMSLYVEACEVFHVHLSEAARLYPLQSLVCKTLAPPIVGNFDKRTCEDEELETLIGRDGEMIESKNDVYSLVVGDGPVGFELSVKTPDFIESLIKKYSNLSKVWYVYSLTGRRLFEMRPHDVSRFHMRSIKSLRCTLAVLCNINLDKLLEEWKKKSAHHRILTPEIYKEMERQVLELQTQKKVLLPKTRR